MYLSQWLKQYWRWLILTVVSIIFFIGASSFNYFTQKNDFNKWLSPDEAANYSFAKLYAQEGRLEFFEKYNLIAEDIMQPRSFRSDFGWLKPVSFLGMILIYGKIASVFGYKVLPYLTPLFAAIGIIFYYLFIREIFGRRNGLISALLLAMFPPYLYYSARSMFHNVLFVVLLIIGLYFAVIMVKRQRRAKGDNINKKSISAYAPDVYAGLGGIFLGLAIAVRSSELVWLGPLFLIIWLFNIHKAGFLKPLIFLFFACLSMVPVFYSNKILYGSYWRGGYNDMNQTILNLANASSGFFNFGLISWSFIKSNLRIIRDNFFYFGLDPYKSLKMFYYYFVSMFYWLFWPMVLGFLLFAQKIKKWKIKHASYLLAWLAVSAILLLYYGSWDFHDNPDLKSFTIGNSYVRYWLPIYLGALPLVSIFIIRLSSIFKKKILTVGTRVLLLLAVFIISLRFVLIGSAEGLISSAEKQLASRQELARVLNLTESNSVIITRYHDKLFFPERKVIVGLFDDDNMIKDYAALLKYLPVYYYNFTFPQKDIEYLNNKRLATFGLQIMPVAEVTKDFTLYHLSLRGASATKQTHE